MMSVGIVSALAACCGILWARKSYLKKGFHPLGVYDSVVVAGARVSKEGRPSRALIRRVEHGVRCVQEGRAERILFTGGPWRGRLSEAEVARSLAASGGLDADKISIEEWSTSTRGNAQFARQVLGRSSVLVVTDSYHAARAKKEFERWFERVDVASPRGAPYPGVWNDLREQCANLWGVVRGGERPHVGEREIIRAARPWEVQACMALRREVFQVEGGVPASIEADGLDGAARHWLALSEGRVVATARSRDMGGGVAKVERVAVALGSRGEDWGRKLMHCVHQDLSEAGFQFAKLHAQVSVAGFYDRLGYRSAGDVFVEADIPHQEMRRSLGQEGLESLGQD